MEEDTLLETKVLEINVNVKYIDIKPFCKYWSKAEGKDISDNLLYDNELWLKQKERWEAQDNAIFEQPWLLTRK